MAGLFMFFCPQNLIYLGCFLISIQVNSKGYESFQNNVTEASELSFLLLGAIKHPQ